MIRDVLRLFIGGMSTTAHESKVHSTPGFSTPLNVAILDLIDDMDETLARCGNVRISDLIRRPAQECTVWRSGRPKQEWLDGVDRVLQIGVLFKKANGVIGFSRAVTGRISPCPKCTLRTMVSIAGTNTVTCSNCGATTTMDEYSRICLVRAGNQKRSTEQKRKESPNKT